jgi:hypothetical protein
MELAHPPFHLPMILALFIFSKRTQCKGMVYAYGEADEFRTMVVSIMEFSSAPPSVCECPAQLQEGCVPFGRR